MDELVRLKYTEWSWAIEEYHRGIKQFVGIERAQVQSARTQRNHIGLALRAFLRIEHYCYHTGASWFEAKLSIVRDAVRAYLAQPLYTLQSLRNSYDIVFIFEVVLSLMALIFAYDALAGERERGTLRLVLTHLLSRGHILLAKYIGAMLCLLMPLMLSLLLSLILLTTTAPFSLGVPDFLRIGGIVVSAIAYLSVFYFIGLLISAMTQRGSTALMLSLFVWGFLVLVYPNMILAAIKPSEPPQADMESTLNQMKQMWNELDRERKHFLVNDAVLGEDWTYFKNPGVLTSGNYRTDKFPTLSYSRRDFIHVNAMDEEFEPQVSHAQKYFSFLGSQTIDTAERTWLVRKPALENIFVQPANTERILLKLSPVGVYDSATQAWAGTNLFGIRDFFDAARRYRQTVIDHFIDNKTFGARQWFSSDKGAADWSTLPQFSFQRVNIEVNAKRALPDLCL